MVELLTGASVTVNVAEVAPCATVTLAGTLAAEVFELESATTTPPVPAAEVRVTVPVAVRPLPMVLGLTEILLKAAVGAARRTGTMTPNQGVVPPVQVAVAVWIPVPLAAFASETIPGLVLGATVIPVYPVPALPVNVQHGTPVTAKIRSLAFTVGPLVVRVAVVPPVVLPAAPELSTSSKQLLIGEQDVASAPAFHSVMCNCK